MSYSHCIGGRQQTCPQILRADGIGFFLLIVLALIVSADSHGKGKSDDEAEKRQGSGQDNFKVLAGLVIKFVSPRAEQDPYSCRKPQHEDRERENEEWKIQRICH